MLLEIVSSAKDLGRLQTIAGVLVRHGLGDAVRRLGLARLLSRAGRVLRGDRVRVQGDPPQVRLRRALEELGPTFVKLGQMLAGRSDLLPPAWTAELARLQQHAAPVPIEEIRAQIVEDLGDQPEAFFRDFDPVPLAAASIAQVHRARLAGGEQVVIKVRRPGIREFVEADLRLLARLAERIEDRLPGMRRFRPRALVRQFGRSLRNELDLRIEARNAERLGAGLLDNDRIVIPRMHGEWTRERLCVMDFLVGPSLLDWIQGPEFDRGEAREIASRGADTILEMVFVQGCFHADPHPGNILVLPDGRLGLVDFGMVGNLPDARRRELLDLLMAVVEQDIEGVRDVLVEWSVGESEAETLLTDCAEFVGRYHGVSLVELDTTELLGDLTALLRDNDLYLPSDVALLLKVFLTLDGLGRTLAPDFVMAKHVEPFASRAWREVRSPGATLRRNAKKATSLISALPDDLRNAARCIRGGRVHLEMDLPRLERFAQRIDRSANRLTVGMVTAALIIGTSIALTVSGGPRLLGMPLFGFLGFTSSIVGGVWLLGSILRASRRSSPDR